MVGLIEDFGGKEINSDQAVRLIILIIMVVFDPLAILLLVAAQTTYYKYKPRIESSFFNMKDHVLYKTAEASQEVSSASSAPSAPQQDSDELHKLNKSDINVRLEEYEVNVNKQEGN